jgi:mannose-6-phosphate isomerase-like protein (cupin superfamily)
MHSKHLRFGKGFRPAFAVRKAQAAEMVIAPGDSEGGPGNFHRGADQWVYVVSGTGIAIVDGARRNLRAGSLLLIERRERHEIRNTGRTLLKTLNFYSPPAYRDDGEPLPAGRRAVRARRSAPR